MASIEKFPDSAVVNELRHNNREIKNDHNRDIDPERTPFNYSLTPNRINPDGSKMTEFEYYKWRKYELYAYKRRDIKCLAGAIVSLPKEITTEKEQKRFFKAIAYFFSKRYGVNNVISITVHLDEGKHLKLKDSAKRILSDSEGNPITEFHLGQPHLHFCWIPAIKIDHEALAKKSHHIKDMDNYAEKICANEVITKQDLRTLHSDLQRFLDRNNIAGNVKSGITKEQGGNRTVKEYKKEFEQLHEVVQTLTKRNSKLLEQVKSLTQDKQHLQDRVQELEQIKEKEHEKTESGWGETSGWEKDTKSWEKTF